MIPPCPLRFAPGVVPALLAVWLALSALGAAQFSQPQVVLPEASARVRPPWPEVDWGLLPTIGERDAFEWLRNGKAIPDAEEAFAPFMGAFALANNERLVDLNANPAAGGWLGPVDDFLVSRPGDPGTPAFDGTGTTGEPARIQIGNVSFNRTAASLDVQKVDVARADDLSRVSGLAAPPSNVAASVPLAGWAVVGLALLAIVIAVVIGDQQNDRRHRKHRDRHRHHRRSDHGPEGASKKTPS